jgi:hypothetical protein
MREQAARVGRPAKRRHRSAEPVASSESISEEEYRDGWNGSCVVRHLGRTDRPSVSISTYRSGRYPNRPIPEQSDDGEQCRGSIGKYKLYSGCRVAYRGAFLLE